jgi:hypothetical protein
VEYVPAYAHDLDPVEGLWANLKGVELANLCCDTIAEVLDAARAGIGRVRQERTLLFRFFGSAVSPHEFGCRVRPSPCSG